MIEPMGDQPTFDPATFAAASPDDRVLALAALCERGAPLIREYFLRDPARGVYVDGVVGVRHEVDVRLPERVLAAIRSAGGVPPHGTLAVLARAYWEPMAAHQDDDLVFEDGAVELVYLAIYNVLVCCEQPTNIERARLVVTQIANALKLGPAELEGWWRER
jgi:hypothetical protein